MLEAPNIKYVIFNTSPESHETSNINLKPCTDLNLLKMAICGKGNVASTNNPNDPINDPKGSAIRSQLKTFEIINVMVNWKSINLKINFQNWEVSLHCQNCHDLL